jgi:hypothetical protein
MLYVILIKMSLFINNIYRRRVAEIQLELIMSGISSMSNGVN